MILPHCVLHQLMAHLPDHVDNWIVHKHLTSTCLDQGLTLETGRRLSDDDGAVVANCYRVTIRRPQQDRGE